MFSGPAVVKTSTPPIAQSHRVRLGNFGPKQFCLGINTLKRNVGNTSKVTDSLDRTADDAQLPNVQKPSDDLSSLPPLCAKTTEVHIDVVNVRVLPETNHIGHVEEPRGTRVLDGFPGTRRFKHSKAKDPVKRQQTLPTFPLDTSAGREFGSPSGNSSPLNGGGPPPRSLASLKLVPGFLKCTPETTP